MFKVALMTVKKRDEHRVFENLSADVTSIALGTYLLREMLDVDLLVTDEVDDIIAFDPDLVGFSSASANYGMTISAAKRVKLVCDVPIIIGGSHITSLPESLDPIFDVAVVGEGEETLRDLVAFYLDPKHDQKNLSKIRGLALWDGDRIVRTPKRPPIGDLGTLPIPDRRRWIDQIGMPYLMTMRGCPYNCYFCSSGQLYKNVRYFPVDHVLEELHSIADDFQPHVIRFFDDIFTLDKDRVRSITERMIQEGLTKDIGYVCWTRADQIDEEYVEMLAKANFINAAFGVESASEKVMRRLKGGGVDLKKVQKGIDMIHRAGMQVSCTFIIGIPGETVKDLDANYAFIEKNADKLFDLEINPLMPYPGAPLWKDLEKRGLVSSNMDWDRLSDTGVPKGFDPESYIYLNDATPYDVFLDYVERFKVLFEKISYRERNIKSFQATYPSGFQVARLKRLA